MLQYQSMSEITRDIIESFTGKLDSHPVYSAVDTVERLQCFMQHHVYSVWDFMSLIKFLQHLVAPAQHPWTPRGDASVRRFINELVLEEESDTDMDGKHTSHFEFYLRAMNEIGADTSGMQTFIATLEDKGLEAALALDTVPAPSRQFTSTTFQFINRGEAHEVAAALALGREHIIPGMFRSILSQMNIDDSQAPMFHFYLNRHVHLDEDFHAPLSLRLLNSLCTDKDKTDEAIAAAQQAVSQRLVFWDGVLDALEAC